ncbi:MAG: P1 family peptidase, partial [Acidimicrobiia bacterium]
LHTIKTVDHGLMSPLFRAAADAVEESIINALCAAETMVGFRGRVAHELPLDRLGRLVGVSGRHAG